MFGEGFSALFALFRFRSSKRLQRTLQKWGEESQRDYIESWTNLDGWSPLIITGQGETHPADLGPPLSALQIINNTEM